MLNRTLTAVLLTTSLAACGHEAHGPELPPTPVEQTGPIEVTVTPPSERSMARAVSVTGHFRPIREADIGADVVGRIIEVAVEEGDRVSEGDLLVRINASHARANSAQAEASAGGIDAQIGQLELDIERLEPLVEGGVVAGAELDQLRTQHEMLTANRRAASAAIRAARSTLPSYEVRAPFDGIVEDLNAELGEIAVAGGASLVRIVDLSAVEAEVDVPETAIQMIEASPNVTATTRAYQEEITGTVTRIGTTFHPETHAAPVVVRFDNPNGRLRAGMFVSLTFEDTQRRPSLVLPASQVHGSAGARFAFVVQDGVVEERPIEVQPTADGDYEITAGLTAMDSVVSSASSVLEAGKPVVVAALQQPTDEVAQ